MLNECIPHACENIVCRIHAGCICTQIMCAGYVDAELQSMCADKWPSLLTILTCAIIKRRFMASRGSLTLSAHV